MSVAAPPLLPAGTTLRPLEPHLDERGSFTELYRAEWGDGRHADSVEELTIACDRAEELDAGVVAPLVHDEQA